MKIKVAKNSGFCFGVKRAVNISLETTKLKEKVVTFGPIIHNPQMVSYLKKCGVGFVNEIDDIVDETVIIRSHGITAQDYKKLLKKRVEIVDATCPIVKKAQDFAKKLTQDGFRLVILGEKNHPEVKALLSYVDDNAIVISGPEKKISLQENQKIGLIAQTTQIEEKFEQLAVRLLKSCKELYVVKTICNATFIRQAETKELAKNVDVLFVVGGKNSANTARLAEIARAENCKTYHIETAAEIEEKSLKNINYLGIAGGASTPDWIIEDVKRRIKKIKKT
ncbi:MAG: 4-hydroxy-3-methylbut-2-enyl diphosphate reductase [Candidatus Cloacimonetes bacterium]|nr:4-hydroxy-3-methylbut-2-enyl diphosphate reductase [Candidatus Cloacimonadota bacterium]